MRALCDCAFDCCCVLRRRCDLETMRKTESRKTVERLIAYDEIDDHEAEMR